MKIKYHFWNQLTYELLQPAMPEDEILENHHHDGYATVAQVVDLIKSETGWDAPAVLERIAVCAVAMYGHLNMIALDWRITFGHPVTGQISGFSFESEYMDVDGFLKEGPVDLVTAPLLCLHGDFASWDYGQMEKISNMRVLLDWTRRQKQTVGGPR